MYAGGVRPETAHLFTSPKRQELDLVFQFQHVVLDEMPGQGKWALKPLHLPDLKRVLSVWQSSILRDGWIALYWNNHDQPRIVSRWGSDKELRIESAKALAIILHVMRGTPVIYQGEEIGMTNLPSLALSDYRDIETINMYQEKSQLGWSHERIMSALAAKSRDNARSPMQWANQPMAGFSTVEPWIAVNPNYVQINVEQALADPDSLFYHYQRLIQLRKLSEFSDTILSGEYQLHLPDDEQLFVYTREGNQKKLAVIANLSPRPALFPGMFSIKQTILSSYVGDLALDELKGEQILLRPWAAYLVEIE